MNKKVIEIIRRSELHQAVPEQKKEASFSEHVSERKYMPNFFELLNSLKKILAAIPWKIVVACLVLFGIGGSVIGIPIVFGNVTLEVRPESREISLSKEVYAVVNLSEKDESALRIPAIVLEKEEEGTRLFSSTGKVQKGEYASGKINVFNSGSAPQVLVQNTRFISENGKLFKSQSRVTVPAQKQGVVGSVEVNVIAAESGDAYNIDPSSFSLPGLAGSAAFTTVYGKSLDTMKGGTTKEVSVVTKEDIEKAKNQLFESLQSQAERSLIGKLSSGYEIPEHGFITEVLSTSSLVKEGSELQQFSSSAKIKVRGFSFKKAEFRELLFHVLEAQAQEQEEINQETVQVRYEVGTIDRSGGVARLDGFIQGRANKKLDTNALLLQIVGKTREEAEQILDRGEGILNHKLSLWPFWMTTLPKDMEKIHVQLQY